MNDDIGSNLAEIEKIGDKVGGRVIKDITRLNSLLLRKIALYMGIWIALLALLIASFVIIHLKQMEMMLRSLG